MVISKKTNFPRFQRGDGGSNIFQGGGGGPNANFYRNPLFPPSEYVHDIQVGVCTH